jgi:hypothetical protein
MPFLLNLYATQTPSMQYAFIDAYCYQVFHGTSLHLMPGNRVQLRFTYGRTP